MSEKKVKESRRFDENGTITTNQARDVLLKAQKDNASSCMREVQSVLDRYNCTMDVSMILKAGSIIPNLQIISKGEKR